LQGKEGRLKFMVIHMILLSQTLQIHTGEMSVPVSRLFEIGLQLQLSFSHFPKKKENSIHLQNQC